MKVSPGAGAMWTLLGTGEASCEKEIRRVAEEEEENGNYPVVSWNLLMRELT